MGAFTTYSTFAYNTSELLRQSHPTLAALNMVSQNVLGIVALFAGLALSKVV